MQVLSNLIGNALKFTPAKGQICISCARTSTEGKEVQVSVSDTGEGIAPEQVTTVFERFSQIHRQSHAGRRLDHDSATINAGQMVVVRVEPVAEFD